MKRIIVCALVLAGFACSSAGKTSSGGGAGGTTDAVTGTGGTSGTTTNTGVGSGGSTGGATGTTSSGTGGNTGTGTGGASGTTSSGTGGSTKIGTGGATSAGTGGTTKIGTGGATGTSTGGTTRAGSGGTASGGMTGAVTGGTTGASTGGTTGGGPTPILVTGPTYKDPTTVAADLTKYYVSSINGNDTNTGTSPEQAWASLSKIPKTKAAVFFEKGSKWTITAGGTTRSGLSIPAGSVYATYGTGERPLIYIDSADQKTTVMSAVQLSGNSMVEGLKFMGYAVIGFPVSSNNNIVQNCEIDGKIEGQEYGKLQLGFSISGQYNVIVGNIVQNLSGMSGDSGNVNTSGGSEAFVMNAGNNEVAYNTAINCWGPNKTLGGAEGGCLEIIGNKAGQLIENAFFHHNYCERSVGLFEACAGNFSGDGQNIMLNHAKVRNSTVSYNVSIDAMWLYLLQPTNTDFENLVFEHNTLIHGPANTDIPQGGASSFGLAYDTDPVWNADKTANIPCTTDADCTGPKELCLDKGGSKICQYQFKLQPGTVFVRNNLFVVLPDADAAMMVLPPGPDDAINNIFVPKAPMGLKAGAGVIVVSDAGLVDTYKLTATSPEVDKGSSDLFQPWLDWDGHKVPCGSAPDIGAVECCP